MHTVARNMKAMRFHMNIREPPCIIIFSSVNKFVDAYCWKKYNHPPYFHFDIWSIISQGLTTHFYIILLAYVELFHPFIYDRYTLKITSVQYCAHIIFLIYGDRNRTQVGKILEIRSSNALRRATDDPPFYCSKPQSPLKRRVIFVSYFLHY